ncbi:hypothetical protein [Massilia sp. BKSP1R2A-1]|uniref:hypothetical protein n=1 Tax=Massilia sp. BKSP1R2A-1 TaxID=3422595 RepID=UPI003D32A79A
MMADQTLDALNEVHGQAKPDDIGLGEWIWGALQGDFNAERTTGQIGFDMVVSLIPVVDTLCDLRDLCANIRQYRADPKNTVTLFFIATTVVGFIPEFGTVVKSALRLVWVYLKPLAKHADDITNTSKLIAAAGRACDAALPKISEYLQHNRVAKWATDGKLPDIYKFMAETIREAGDKVDPAKLKAMLDEKFEDLRALLGKIRPILPSNIRERLDELMRFTDAKRSVFTAAVTTFAKPVKTVLKIIVKKLDDQAWKVETYRTNRGWIAPISQSGSAKLINANPPRWATKRRKRMKYPPIEMPLEQVNELMRVHPGHPKIDAGAIKTFSQEAKGLRADAIKGPAKLYRIVDPSNEGGGMFWMTEAEFKAVKNRDEWRSRFAVKPEWNQNGWVVEYEIKAGEELPVWRGPAASQELDGTDYYLEGGGEQIVFYPGKRDEMVQALPRIDRETGLPIQTREGVDRRVEFTDVTGAAVPTKLRSKIADPHITGPTETGWGASDFTPQEAKRILLTVPSAL